MGQLLALVLVSFVPLQTGPQEPAQHPVADSAAQPDPRGTATAPLVVQVIGTPKDTTETDRQAKSEAKHLGNETLVAWGTVGLAGVTLALAIVTGILARYTFKLWRETKTLADDANRNAGDQGRQMRESLTETRIHNERESRAYVVIENAKLPHPSDLNAWKWSYDIHDTGRIPAYNVRASMRSEFRELATIPWPEFPIPLGPEDLLGTIGPGRHMTTGGPVTGVSRTAIDNTIKRPSQCGVMLAVTVRYDDAFGVDRMTHLLQMAHFINGGWEWVVFPTRAADT